MSESFKTIIEPFKIKSVEPLLFRTAAERKNLINEAGLNVFLLKSQDVLIDLLTDSGTTAMSSEQWSALMRGDEAYAGSPSFYRFEKSVRDITGLPEIIPTHQGRAAERILFHTLAKPGDFIVSNMLFDTTRANAEDAGCKVIDIPCKEYENTSVAAPFKGNIDIEKLKKLFQTDSDKIRFVVMTLTNNSGGGQPASLENIRETAEICKKNKVPFVIDGCRFAENAWFIKEREKKYAQATPLQIAQEFFSYADIVSVSAKKDGMANMGGFLALRNSEWAQNCRNNLILTEGFPTYGGLSGRELETIAVGLWEALDPDYLRYRIRSTAYLGEALNKIDFPIVNPPGGHAVYLDAAKLLPHIPKNQFPGQALVASLYEFSGIRGVEIGSVMFGRELRDGTEQPHSQELVRLAIPRRTYTQSHIDYVIEALSEFKKMAPKIKGVKFIYKPKVLRHFTARFSWI